MSFVLQKLRVNTKQTRQYGGNLFYSKDRQNNVKYVGSDNMFTEKNNHTIIHCICQEFKKKIKFSSNYVHIYFNDPLFINFCHLD